MALNKQNLSVFHRTLYGGNLVTVLLYKRGLDQREGTIVVHKLFQCRRKGPVTKTGEPIQHDIAVGSQVTWLIPRTELERIGVRDINTLDMIVEHSVRPDHIRWWEPEATTVIDDCLFENYIRVDCLRVDPPDLSQQDEDDQPMQPNNNTPKANTFRVAGYPSSTLRGVSNNATLTVFDQFGNIFTSYAGTVTFSSDDNTATLPSQYTFTAVNAGVYSFPVTFNQTGTFDITATDVSNPSLAGTQQNIVVTSPSVASSFTLVGFPSPTNEGADGNITLTVKDQFGNTYTSYTGTVTFTSNDGAATLPSNYTFVAGDAGVKVFTAILNTAGTRSITATDTVTSSLTGAQTGISVVSCFSFPAEDLAGSIAFSTGNDYVGACNFGSNTTYNPSAPSPGGEDRWRIYEVVTTATGGTASPLVLVNATLTATLKGSGTITGSTLNGFPSSITVHTVQQTCSPSGLTPCDTYALMAVWVVVVMACPNDDFPTVDFGPYGVFNPNP